MASDGSLLIMSEETFDYICTPCAEENLIKEALKYCVECQHYCCNDCLSYHRRIPLLKGHTFLDNSSVKTERQPSSIPAFPTKQCSKHVGKIVDMFCKTHDVVCCYACAAEDHISCTDMMSVSDNIDRLYNKTHTSEVTSELSDILDDMNKWQADTDTILQQLQNSKVAAVKAVSDCRAQLEKFLKKLEQESIKEIEVEYKILESQILEGRKRFVDSIDDLKNLKQLIVQASTNKAQLFVCTNLAEKKCATLEFNEMKRKTFNHAEVKFVPSKLLKSSVKKIKHLGEASAISSRNDNLILYKATKICDMDVGLKEDRSQDNCEIWGSCIIDDTVIFTDYSNHKLKRYDILSSSLIDYCDVPYTPYGVCRVGDTQVAVACKYGVQFVSIHNKLSFSRSMYINHECYSIAYSNNRLYITDQNKSLCMYDMSGKLLTTVTSDKSGQPLFQCSKHITFNDKKDRLFVCDEYKGLVCFNAQCDYVETITYHNISPTGVYIDGHGNVIVADNKSQIIQCEREGQKRGIIVNKTGGSPLSVCIHHGLKKMFVSFYSSNTVEVYNVFWEDD